MYPSRQRCCCWAPGWRRWLACGASGAALASTLRTRGTAGEPFAWTQPALKPAKRLRTEGCANRELERLPEFDFVAVGIVDPGEAAVAFILALGVDTDAVFGEAIEESVQVVDDVVDHERSLAGLEVLGVARKNAPDGHLLAFGIVFFTPRQNDSMAAVGQAEMFPVPFLHLLLIGGFEEDAADAEDAAFLSSLLASLLTHRCFPFCGMYGGNATTGRQLLVAMKLFF